MPDEETKLEVNKSQLKLKKFEINTSVFLKNDMGCELKCNDFTFHTLNVAKRSLGLQDEFDDLKLSKIDIPTDSNILLTCKERMLDYKEKYIEKEEKIKKE